MAKKCVVNVDLVDIFENPGRKGFLHTMAWGDRVDVEDTTSTHAVINTVKYETKADGSILPVKTKAFIEPRKGSRVKAADALVPAAQSRVLKVNFIDVQQGDGAVIETPEGEVILVDGGDNQLFARYLASRFRGTSKDKPQEVACIVVTHGDADHFQGLTRIHESETNNEPKKRLFISPQRVYHNGLVKRPSKTKTGKSVADKDMLGATKTVGKTTIVTDLHKTLLTVSDDEMNEPFRKWKAALKAWNDRMPGNKKIDFRRMEFGDADAFKFFNNGDRRIDVLGPFITKAGNAEGLKFLRTPPSGPRLDHESISMDDPEKGSLSASHTINGHSVILRLKYGGFSYLLTGDLNDEAGRILAQKHQTGEIDLRSEVFKVPHHGSADFSGAFFQRVSPIVSVVSSGDESAAKEYIHPRATLMGALGKHSRVQEPLIFVTELVAFMKVEGWSKLTDATKAKKRGDFFGFSRAAYGSVKTRTDGKRLLVYTDSGKADMKEAYAYILDQNGQPVPSAVLRV